MKAISTYLTFEGNCREAMSFYAKCLGAELRMMTFAEAQMPCPPSAKEKIMHARISKGSAELMASDSMPDMKIQKGNNFSISLDCENAAEIEKLFGSLGQNGKITMPLQETSWASRFGMLTDQYGVQWMFNLTKT